MKRKIRELLAASPVRRLLGLENGVGSLRGEAIASLLQSRQNEQVARSETECRKADDDGYRCLKGTLPGEDEDGLVCPSSSLPRPLAISFFPCP